MTSKIALVNLWDRTHYCFHLTEYLAFGYLKACLAEAGFEVDIIDGYVELLTDEEVRDRVLQGDYMIVGFSPSYQTKHLACNLAKTIKARRPRTHIVAGGQHVSFFPQALLSGESPFDSVVVGEGEASVVDLAQRLASKKSLRDAPGIHFRDNGNVVANPPRPAIEDLDALPFPARGSIDYWRRYKDTPQLHVLASRDCPWACSFCHVPGMNKLNPRCRWRTRSAGNVAEELQELVRKYNIRHINFLDLQFLGYGQKGQDWARSLASEIIDRRLDITIEFQCRSDTITEEIIAELKKAGLSRVCLGLESGCQGSLKAYSKGLTVADNRNAVRILKQYDIGISGSGFIMFNPYSTVEGLRESLEFLKEIGEANFSSIWSELTLFPGSSIVEQLRSDRLLAADYSHDRVMAYGYVDKRVERMMSYFRGIALPAAVARCQMAVFLVDFGIDFYKTMFRSYGDTPARHPKLFLFLERFLCALIPYRKRIAQLNYAFFEELLDAVESGKPDDCLHRARDSYLRGLETVAGSFADLFDQWSGLNRNFRF